MNYNHPIVGSSLEKDSATFILWAPLVNTIELVLPKKNKKHVLARDERGNWSIKLSNVSAGEQYLYRIDKDDSKVFPDPASRCQPEGVHGPSAIVDKTFPWTDKQWKGIPLSDMVIYELHVGTFTEQGTFEGVISRLPYLKDLGINAIELMPLAQFPGDRNWGYDGVYPFAVQESYGGVQGLKNLVNEAHKQSIAIILDVVYNHLGPEGNYLGEFAPYFTERYKTFWGSALNYDDAWCDGVRNFYWQNAIMWLDEFHVDGLRLDAVHAIWDSSASHFIEELKTKVNTVEEQTGQKKVLIAEFDLNNPRYINEQSEGGYGLDGQWIDEFHHALHAIVTEEKNGYYEDFGETEHLVRSLKDSYVYTGQYSLHRKKDFGVKPDNPYSQFVVFAQNHDQIGNRLLGDRLTEKLSYEALKLVAATVLLSPHVPLLFMGEEYGEKNPFQYFISHTDKKLVDMVRKGRKEEFAYFGWQEEVPDPQGEKTFLQCKLSWSLENNDQDAKKLFEFYKYLIDFRKVRIAMKSFERDSLKMIPIAQKKVIGFERTYSDDIILIVLNFNQSQAVLSLPNKKYQKIFDSSASEWNGPGASLSSQTNTLSINSQSVVIFEIL